MKYKKIMLFFSVALPLSIGLRLIQLWFTVEAETGFFKQEFESYGNYMLAVIFAFSLATGIFGLTAHRSPEHPPKSNTFLSISAIALSISILFEAFTESFLNVAAPWQMMLLKVSGFAAALFFAAFGLKGFLNFDIPNIFTALPTVYLIVRIICDFTAISSLAVISDNLILLAAYCLSLLFMLKFANLYNGVDGEYNFRRLLATGLPAVILCFTQSVPHIIINLVAEYSYLHTSVSANINLLIMGIFIAAFTFSHFSYQNACTE